MSKGEWFVLALWANWLVLTWLGLLGFQFAISFWWPWVVLLILSVVGAVALYGNHIQSTKTGAGG